MNNPKRSSEHGMRSPVGRMCEVKALFAMQPIYYLGVHRAACDVDSEQDEDDTNLDAKSKYIADRRWAWSTHLANTSCECEVTGQRTDRCKSVKIVGARQRVKTKQSTDRSEWSANSMDEARRQTFFASELFLD